MGTSPGRSGCAKMRVHAYYILESEGGLVLYQLESAVASVIQFTRQLSK